MSVNRYWMPIIVISVLLGTVMGSQVLGEWSISGRTSVNLEQFQPEEIKGWMTLQQVADGLGLSLDDVYRVGGLPAEIAPDTALKDMEDIVEVSELRETLAAYLDGETVAVPEADATPEAAPAEVPHTGDGTGPTPLPPGQILPADQIKGRLTLREVSEQCAVDLDALLVALDLPADTDPDTQLKTLTQAGTLDEVTQVQAAVAALQEMSN